MQCSEASTTESDDGPYEQFLAGQRQRVLGWKAIRQSKSAKTAQTADPAPNIVACSSAKPSREDEVETELRQRLAAKAEECRHLVTRLDAMEEASSKILSCQMQMQEKFIKVISIPLAFFLLGVGIISEIDKKQTSKTFTVEPLFSWHRLLNCQSSKFREYCAGHAVALSPRLAARFYCSLL